MSHSLLDPQNSGALKYIFTHLSCPIQVPDDNDQSVANDHSLATAVASAARLFLDYVDQASQFHWHRILRMLDNLSSIVQFENLDRTQTVSQLAGMNVGDILTFLIRAQNAAVVFRKQQDVTVFESFEVSLKAGDVIATQGKLICSYPGPAIEVPNLVFEEHSFLSELVNFLVHMNNDDLYAASKSRKAHATVLKTPDIAPRYITELLTGILRSVGHPADIVRISKRVGDEVGNNSELPWRRSSLWLAVRVVLHTSLNQSTLGRDTYKVFMLFFMCCIARERTSEDLPNNLLQSMSAKISRRLRKLGSSAPDWLSDTVFKTCDSLRSTLEKRFRQVQAVHHVSRTPSRFDLWQDIQLSLRSSGDYIRNSLVSHNITPVDTHFNPTHHPRGVLDDFLSSKGTFFEEAYRIEPHVALYDVERAVEGGIDGWVEQAAESDEACAQLEGLANTYSTRALKTYENDPELLSVMLLTMIELWVALDKIANRVIPMLADYSPEVPICLLEGLLLRKASSLCRVRQMYQYLSHRHSQSRSGWSVFSPSVTSNHFAVRYFGESPDLQTLKTRIEANAQNAVVEKITELEKANARYTDMKQKCLNTSHSPSVTQDGREFHSKNCSRCDLERELGKMEIAVHEWPLPTDNLQAELVVFELNCPVSFNMWRTATFHLLVDLCSPTRKPEKPSLKLDEYGALRPYLVQHPKSRISLASTTKSFVVKHYKETSIPSTQTLVCVNNGLEFFAYDPGACIPVSDALSHIDVLRHCTYQLEGGPYENLQKYVATTSHTSNEVLANQTDCHKDISIHEFVAFGHLRAGGSLQWLNIFRALRDRSLSFRRHEIHLLVAQAASQVGPLCDSRWTWHEEIQQPSFCYAFVEELGSLLNDITANWLERVTMATISFLLCRLLTSSPDQAVSQKVLELLRTVRGRVFCWVGDLSNKLSKTQGDEELRALLRDTAAVCRSTFDVDPVMFPEVLCSAEDVEVLLSCAIIIHDNTLGDLPSLPAHSQFLLDRDRRLTLDISNVLGDVIGTEHGNQGVDLAVRQVWPVYRRGSKWSPLQSRNPRWFSCTTASTESQCSQVVYLDLLDGSLLVNGKPLGRLPKEIVQQPLYNRIFGEQVLDVVPADHPGMDCSTRDVISNHQVYFSLIDEDLVIRAKKGVASDSAILELIPQEKLVGDLPAVLIEGHAHWLNLSTSTLEIRPLDKLWEESSENWRISCIPGQYRMYRGLVSCIDIRSSAWEMVSNLLKPLDSPQNLIVTASPVESSQPQSPLQLSVDLPRYGLSFYVNDDGDLESRNIRGMVYDQNQSIGAMYGLLNKLVLRPKTRDVNAEELIPRCILIPEGDISYHTDGHHVRVEINTDGPALQRMTYQTYRVNADLGCLTGNVSLANRLYCAYLHALTSGCDIDPLTGRSGTEEALSILRSAGCRSIMKLSPRDAELLGLIASICPSRMWYTENRKCMQKVEWLDLPASSQHPELYIAAKAIKEHCERVLLFHGSQPNDPFESFPSRDDDLLNRSALRAAYLFPPDVFPQHSRTEFDITYNGSNVMGSSESQHRAHTVDVQRYFSSCYRNLELKEHLVRVQNILKTRLLSRSLSTLAHQYSFQSFPVIPSGVHWSLAIDKLFTRPAPSLQEHHNVLPRYTPTNVGSTSGSERFDRSLRQLVDIAGKHITDPFQLEYISKLRTSAECFKTELSLSHEATMLPTVETLAAHYAQCKDSYYKALRALRHSLGPKDQSERALEKAGQWPRITVYALFRFLAPNSPIALSDHWKRCLTTLALLALELQRARRLLRLRLDNHPEELCKELLNESCDGWDAEAHPDWLLIQLQGNFLIRRVQVDVANQMISPLSGTNTTMQLNMGEGKSSVIIPMSVVFLADGDQVARVIVPKALSAQMFQLLVDRLGGLANRRIYIIPFSRSLQVNSKHVTVLRELMAECMKERGVLVAQPEHVLSLKLTSVEKQLSRAGDAQLAKQLLELQRWLHFHSRDIMDESDEILHVRYELAYAIGHQQHIEGFPERWTTTQRVLDLVKKHASHLGKDYPHGVEYEAGSPESFPHFRILEADAGEKLVSLVVQDIMNDFPSNLIFQGVGREPRDLQVAIQKFISCEDVSSAVVQLVKGHYKQTPLWNGLLLLRGLLAAGILLFAFRERRWRVDYGLAPVRTMLAVPYKAKDIPAQRAEFGHPDVAIILSCLSYYYGGLDQEQLGSCFEILLNQEDSSADYDLWVRGCSSVPESLRSWNGINITSSEQWRDFLLPLFSRNKATIDFYLSKVVFPMEAKEFPSKLSCSGWDLAEKRERVLTGFSRTSDGRYLLPLHISQHDPEHQRGTNAKVLAYILQPENSHYMCTTHENGKRRKTSEFLTVLVSQQPEIRVLLDVGAQMLDLQNKELAAAWLAISPASLQAAIYFNEDDELTVLTRDGSTELLLSSPFARQLDRCIVHLDHAHTYGTDINFPSGFRAAVTLGPKVTKDRLVQGCMRMRKLGHGHSIMFFAPLEVDHRIRHVVHKAPSNAINVVDILQWVIRETCDDIQQCVPQWAQKGTNHASRYSVSTNFREGMLSRKQRSAKWLQPQAKKLKELYGPHSASDFAKSHTSDIRRHCISLGVSSVRAASMDEEQEQECEIIHEVKPEKQHVERKRLPRASPRVHSIHPDVVTFVMTGIIPRHTKAFGPAFETLRGTSAVTREAHVWSPFVLATIDFQKTVNSAGKLDDFLRPVQWVVSGIQDGSEVLVILSPYEADHLMQDIRSHRKVHLHLYAPRVAKLAKPCDDFALYSIPAVPAGWTPPVTLMDQLNVFSGQLYLKDYETYVRLCRFLCVYGGSLQGEDAEGIEIGNNEFITPKDRRENHSQTEKTFKETPIGFLRTLISIRRKGILYASTHMGKLLDGQPLSEGDFDGWNGNTDDEY